MPQIEYSLYAVNAEIFDQDTLASGIIDIRMLERLEAVVMQFTSAAGTPAVKLEYAISADGTTFGAYTDFADIFSDSSAWPTPEGVYTVDMPNVLAPFVKFLLTGLAGNQADTIIPVSRLVAIERWR